MATTGEHGTPWVARRRQRYIDRAAQRMHDRLMASPTSYRTTPSTVVLVAASLGVLTAVAAAVLWLLWSTFHAEGFLGWLGVILGWLVLLALVRRPQRLPDDVRLLSITDAPALHRLVDHMSEAVGAPRPNIIGVNTDFNAYVAPVGVRGRPAMVLGLPLMAMLPWDQRLGVIGHELGHLRGRDTVRGRIVNAAMFVVWDLWWLASPAHPDEWWMEEIAFIGWLSHLVQRVVEVPAGLPFLMLRRLEATSSQHREYLADRRAAEVVGSTALAGYFDLDPLPPRRAARTATLRGENPFNALAHWAAGDAGKQPAGVATAEPHRADASHPPDHLRASLLRRACLPPSTRMPEPGLLAEAQAELAALMSDLERQFRDDLGAS